MSTQKETEKIEKIMKEFILLTKMKATSLYPLSERKEYKLNKAERQERDANILKYRCGNNLSLDRQKEGIPNCPACDEVENDDLCSECIHQFKRRL